jgi:hypothetical protein
MTEDQGEQIITFLKALCGIAVIGFGAVFFELHAILTKIG